MTGLSAENKLRDVFNKDNIGDLANNIAKIWSDFQINGFLEFILPNLPALSFIQRSNLIRDALVEFLPKEFEKSAQILVKALKEEQPNYGVTDWHAFIIMPQCAYISLCGKEHFDISMNALYEMTKRFSAEGDLRTFLNIDFAATMKLLHKWCNDPSPHVKRLVSEGTRPRLPLGGRIKTFQENPKPLIELLDKLKNDESLYVRRSVANNINDIAKDNPDIAIETLKKWHKDASPELIWVIRHASRSLIKNGHPEIIKMLGCDLEPQIKLSELKFDKKQIKIGDKITFAFTLESRANKEQSLIIDFIVHYQKTRGRIMSKVFKLRNVKLKAGEKINISKIINIRQTSTRIIYEGIHKISIQINGKIYCDGEFLVTP